MNHLGGGISDSDVRRAEERAYENQYPDDRMKAQENARWTFRHIIIWTAIGLVGIVGFAVLGAPVLVEKASMF